MAVDCISMQGSKQCGQHWIPVVPAPQRHTTKLCKGCLNLKRAHLGALLDISDGVVEVVQADVELCEAGRAAGEWELMMIISNGRARKEQ